MAEGETGTACGLGNIGGTQITTWAFNGILYHFGVLFFWIDYLVHIILLCSCPLFSLFEVARVDFRGCPCFQMDYSRLCMTIFFYPVDHACHQEGHRGSGGSLFR